MNQYYKQMTELKKLEQILIPCHRVVKDSSYPSVRSDYLEDSLRLMKTVPLGGF